jgi:GMP synthase PP-ATPase subunit
MVLFGTLHHPLMKLKKENYRIMQEPLEYFFADELEELEKNVALKRKLWDTLQVFFNVK